jgi:DNA-binding NtrC family response regulator
MLDYHWPGNIRELKHLIERSIILGDEDSIDPLAHQPSKSSGNTPPGTIVSLEEMEKKYIEEVLENFDRNISKTAKALAINRNTLYSKIQKYGL